MLMSSVSAVNYFGLLNSSDEYTTDEMIDGLNLDELENNDTSDLNNTQFRPTSRPFNDQELSRLVLIIVVVLGIALIVFVSFVSYWKYGGRNLP